MRMGPLRAGHLTAGVALFGLGLTLAVVNRILVIEFIKGAAQPATILAGGAALMAALLGKREFRTFNSVLAGMLLVVGGWGLWDEYLAVLDFLNGFLPLFLTAAGVVALASGIRKIR